MNEEQRRCHAAIDAQVQAVDEQRGIQQGPALLLGIREGRHPGAQPRRVVARQIPQTREREARHDRVARQLRVAIDEIDAYGVRRQAGQECRPGGPRLGGRFARGDEVHRREPAQVRVAPALVARAGQAEFQEALHRLFTPGMQGVDGARLPLRRERKQRGGRRRVEAGAGHGAHATRLAFTQS